MATAVVAVNKKKKKPVFTHEEIVELLKRVQAGDSEARTELILGNKRLVWNVVHKKFGGVRIVEKDDLFQIGCIGLIKAIDTFDFSYKVKFSSYAIPIITNEILKFLRYEGQFRVPRRMRELSSLIKRHDLMDKKPEEIKKALLKITPDIDWKLYYIKETLTYMDKGDGVAASLEEKVNSRSNGNKGVTIMDQIEDKSNENWFDKFAIRDAITRLNERERFIVYCRYFKDMQQREIGEKLGISQVQVSRLEKRILVKLKEMVNEY